MTEQEEIKYNEEINKGKHAELAYTRFIKPFLEEKRKVLFEAFQSISVTDVDGLLETKRQLLALNGLEIEIKDIIDTGKMAGEAIAKLNEETTND